MRAVSKVQYNGEDRLPPNVTCFYDNRGKMRFRYRKSGTPSHYFKAEPGTPEFEAELAACRAARGMRQIAGGLRRSEVADLSSRERYWRKAEREVYFVVSDAGPVKIGVADCSKARLVSLQSCSPVRLRLVAVTLGGAKVEREYHARFAEHRLHGEWFSPHPDILAEIARLQPLQSVTR